MTEHHPQAGPPISCRRQIWDLEPDELEDVASHRSITDRTYLPGRTTRPPMPPWQTTPMPKRTHRVAGGGAEDDMASRALRALQAGRRAAGGARYPGLGALRGRWAPRRAFWAFTPRPRDRRDLGRGAQVVGDVRFPAGWIVVVEGPGRGAYFAVTNSVSSIGRGLDQSICLNFGDASISRNNHAAIAYDAEQNRFFLGHGNKSNIVRRNGQPVLSTEELMDGDAIRIGKTTLRFVALCGPGFTWGPDPEEGQPNAD
jgi:hypothetical protein